MTKLAKTDLEEVAKGLADLYVAPEERVLDPTKLDASLLERMPTPTGWRIMVLPYRGKNKTSGGVLLPDQFVDNSQLATVVGYVLKVGPLCFQDKTKFPNGPWCKEGDWVIFPRYGGSRFRIDGGEVRIMNDDEILATILDPDDIMSM
jgi:co-chaperonin GroES (HSP10)|uniref:Co-chaperonin GroES n=1 Tax=uncultured virus TaxID=340016 RepID=A0A221S3A4_9VIRU|nr:co-chaperonin GroES [uncultured virus]